jgi:hypothetical protein
MLMVAHTILAAVLGSLAPVVTFFALTTTSYSFMVLMSTAACALAGMIGIKVFVKAINEPPDTIPVPESIGVEFQEPGASGQAQSSPEFSEEAEEAEEAVTSTGAKFRAFTRPPCVNKNIWQLLGWWVTLYAFVGGQMGWVLRPFIGNPDMPFVLLRGKTGSLLEGILYHIHKIVGG